MATACAKAVCSYSARTSGSRNAPSRTSAALRNSESFGMSVLLQGVEPESSVAGRLVKPAMITPGLRPDGSDDEDLPDPAVKRSPGTAAGSRTQLAQPRPAPHCARVGIPELRPERFQFLDGSDHGVALH